MITLALRRPLDGRPQLDLGGAAVAIVFAVAGALLAQAPTARGALLQTYDGHTVAGRLASDPPALRGAVGYIFPPYEVYGGLRVPPAVLAGSAEVLRRRQTLSTDAAWRRLPAHNGRGCSFAWSPAEPLDAFVGLPWDTLREINPSTAPAWAQAIRRDAAARIGWADDLRHLDPSYAVPWHNLPAVDLAWSMPWTQAPERHVSAAIPWLRIPFKDGAWLMPWHVLQGGALDLSSSAPWFSPPIKDTGNWSLPWGFGHPPSYQVVYELPAVDEPAPRNVRASYVCMDLKRPLDHAHNVNLRLRRPIRTYCDAGSFIVNNTANAITLLDGLDLPIIGASISTDIGSFVWDIRLTLPTLAEYNRCRPSAANDGAKQVQITINGYVWRGFIDTVSRNRDFGGDSFSAQGRSFSAYGAAPFAPSISVVSTQARLAQQLANDAFQYLGFSLTWDAIDWVVPAGLFAYTDKDPMGALSQLCNAAGLVILPGRYDRSLVVRSRYPQTIWHWDDPATLTDGHLPLNQMISGSSRFAAGTDTNKVFVGGTAAGNTVACTRDGTSGSRLAPAVVDALLATDPVAIERGRVELCKGGARIFNTYVTPLVAATESGVRLRAVSELVGVDEDELDDFAYKGLITSLQVAVARTARGELTVYQSMEVERYV